MKLPMKRLAICCLLFSLSAWGQKAEKGILPSENLPKTSAPKTLFVGVDVLHVALAPFSSSKLLQGFAYLKHQKNIYWSLDAGYESKSYQKLGYDAQIQGPFARLGAQYLMLVDDNNEANAVFSGLKLSGSFFGNRYDAVPVLGYQGDNATVAFPASSASAFWLEASFGARTQFFSKKFIIEAMLMPRYMLYASKVDAIKPMYVPGFGEAVNALNLGFSWNLLYQF
jgi:Domain of unknown function (DUF6048)